MEFSIFYFADSRSGSADRYRLLIEGAKFADTHDFSAVWTPERHFHEFGGQYPNPAVIGAALATITQRISIRAGSVAAPLHHPARIAEEWSVVDNLSHGRAGISFASGWHAVDFVLRPDNYSQRKDILVATVENVRRLWRRECVSFVDGTGAEVPVQIYPPPVQPELPIWLTSAGSIDTFRLAGRLGAGLLTNLLGQDLSKLAEKIRAYRAAFEYAHGGRGQIVLMLHTFLGRDRGEVRKLVREPLKAYLRSSVSLWARAASAAWPDLDPEKLSPRDIDFLVDRSFDRHFETGGLFGTIDDGISLIEGLRQYGVDEVACLIDFGIPTGQVLESLELLDKLRQLTLSRSRGHRAGVAYRTPGELCPVELGVKPARSQQFMMAATLLDLACVDHQDLVRLLDRGEPMRNHQRGPSGQRSLQRLLHRRFRFGVEVRGRLVKHDHRRSLEQQPGESQTLLLSAGKPITTVPRHGVEAVGK
jgi:natural product biosynthesis luciferase-like monooxygenase protein